MVERSPLCGVFFRALAGAFKGFARMPARGWAILLGLSLLAIYLASIGACGPWDPWETHYGEVARNIVDRGDPLDLWWRPGYGPDGKKERVFASKHALPFWCMALSMKVFSVGSGPADEMVRSPWPELALRLPSVILGLGTAGWLGWVVGRLHNARAGILTALVIATMPQFAIISRQAITDVYFVGPVCLAMGAWAMAWFAPDRPLRTRGRGLKEVPVDRAYFAFVSLFVVAGVVPLIVIVQHVLDPATAEVVARWANKKRWPKVEDLQAVAVHMIPYFVLCAIVFARSLRWRRRSQVWMGVLYVAGGLSMMGKGMIGPGIIGALVLAHLIASGKWTRLLRCELPIGILVFVVTCFPWHHAMAVFRGESWVRELLIENNLSRFATGEQKQAVGSFAFYVRTLGLAAFPWVGVAVPALWAAFGSFTRPRSRGAEEGSSGGRELHRLALVWFLVSFGLIAYSVTKYYHYLAPCLPPLGVLIGLWLDALLRKGEARARMRVGGALACALGGVAILGLTLRAFFNEPAWLAHLTTYLYTGMWRQGAPAVDLISWCALPFGLGLVLWVARSWRGAVVAMLLSGLLTTTWVINDYLPAASENWSQRTAFQVYFDQRKEPDRLLGWWFYYRGETFFAKRRIWVQTEPNREELNAYIDRHRGKGAHFWVITTTQHAPRAKSHFPRDMAGDIETMYENFHYSLLRVPIP